MTLATITVHNISLFAWIHRRLNDIKMLFPGNHTHFHQVKADGVYNLLQSYCPLPLRSHSNEVPPPPLQDFTAIKLEVEFNKLAQINDAVLDLVDLTQVIFMSIMHIRDGGIVGAIIKTTIQFQGYIIPRVMATLFR